MKYFVQKTNFQRSQKAEWEIVGSDEGDFEDYDEARKALQEVKREEEKEIMEAYAEDC